MIIAAVTIGSLSVAWQASADVINVLNTWNTPRPPAPDQVHLFEFDGDDAQSQGIIADNLADTPAELADDAEGDPGTAAEQLVENAERRRERAEERRAALQDRLEELGLLLP